MNAPDVLVSVREGKLCFFLLLTSDNVCLFVFYIRDTTVQSLTLQPSVKDGLIKYEDSPLVSEL